MDSGHSPLRYRAGAVASGANDTDRAPGQYTDACGYLVVAADEEPGEYAWGDELFFPKCTDSGMNINVRT